MTRVDLIETTHAVNLTDALVNNSSVGGDAVSPLLFDPLDQGHDDDGLLEAGRLYIDVG